VKDATLQDVAALAGVSTGTVSKYINGQKISPKNVERIKKAIEVLHYMPSPLARNFARGKSFDILLFIIVEHPIVQSTWLHELPIIQGINDRLRGSGYSLKIEIASMEAKKENAARIENYARSKYVDAVILLSPWEISDEILVILDYHAFPYLIVGSGKNARQCCSIDFDNYTPIYEIVGRMREAGHARFGMINGFQNQLYAQQREAAFRDALRDLRLPLREEDVRHGDYSLESGIELCGELLDAPDPPTAIVCGNDYVAAGAIRAIQSRRLSVPGDMLVSGFDDTIVSSAMNPTITTVHVSSYEMGRCATEELLKRLECGEYEIQSRLIKSRVIYKQSTGTNGANGAQ